MSIVVEKPFREPMSFVVGGRRSHVDLYLVSSAINLKSATLDVRVQEIYQNSWHRLDDCWLINCENF